MLPSKLLIQLRNEIETNKQKIREKKEKKLDLDFLKELFQLSISKINDLERKVTDVQAKLSISETQLNLLTDTVDKNDIRKLDDKIEQFLSSLTTISDLQDVKEIMAQCDSSNIENIITKLSELEDTKKEDVIRLNKEFLNIEQAMKNFWGWHGDHKDYYSDDLKKLKDRKKNYQWYLASIENDLAEINNLKQNS